MDKLTPLGVPFTLLLIVHAFKIKEDILLAVPNDFEVFCSMALDFKDPLRS